MPNLRDHFLCEVNRTLRANPLREMIPVGRPRDWARPFPLPLPILRSENPVRRVCLRLPTPISPDRIRPFVGGVNRDPFGDVPAGTLLVSGWENVKGIPEGWLNLDFRRTPWNFARHWKTGELVGLWGNDGRPAFEAVDFEELIRAIESSD